VQVLAPGTVRLEVARPLVLERGLVRRPEIRRSAQEPRDVLRQHVQHLARGVAPREALRIGREDGKIPVPAGRELPPLHQIDLVRELRMLRPVRGEELRPASSRLRTARAYAGAEMLPDAVGDEELRVLGPAVAPLAETDLVVSQRLAVRRGGVLLVRRAIADVAVPDDEGGSARRLPE